MKFNENISIFMNDWGEKQNIQLENFYFEEYNIPEAEEDYFLTINCWLSYNA